ncbi:ferritin-like domain-containing protein [Amycolatopsis sp. NPDC006131]|uniref:ferritin-like domain-containing protein n=1 Tax=Amycolatopsis sp. NPDC006131 TaxID=3156731 RepID=UPI0033B29C43
MTGREGVLVRDAGGWLREFQEAARARQDRGDPDWARAARLDPAVVRSLQRFQVGESGDGVRLNRAAERTGDRAYAAAVRLFVAEEQNHARLLARLLEAAGVPAITSHWTDKAFVALRRGLGLRLELAVLLIAETVALSYYRILRDGSRDALTRDVAARILDDEQRHVPFHRDRLRGSMPRPAWWLMRTAWQLLHATTAAVVAWDHGAALRVLGVGRRDFVAEQVRLFSRFLTTLRAEHART